ncbi:MAG: VOC family protein [Gammaproteobacteria bacterium]|nr:VOC family protein [Gammaproteobacteria bacterium]
MDNYKGIHHSSLIVSDTAQALQFYCEVLGMRQVPRMDLPFPGAWLAVGDQQIHLLELANPDPVVDRPEHGGRDRHVAVLVNNLSTIVSALEEANIDYTKSRSGRPALFCRDPDGNAIEIIEVAAE